MPPRVAARAALLGGKPRQLRRPQRRLRGHGPDTATAFRAPGARPFARFGRLNVNGVPTVFAVLGARLDRRCRAELVSRPAAAAAERRHRLGARDRGGRARAARADRRRSLAAARHALSRREAGARHDRGDRLRRRRRRRRAATSSTRSWSRPIRSGRTGRPPSASRRSRPSCRTGRREGRSRSTARTRRGCSAARSRTAASASPNDVVERLWKLVPTGTPVLIRM